MDRSASLILQCMHLKVQSTSHACFQTSEARGHDLVVQDLDGLQQVLDGLAHKLEVQILDPLLSGAPFTTS